MANANLTAHYLRQILHFDPETGVFRWSCPRPKIRVGDVAGTPAAKGHIAIKIDGRSYKAHRLAWLYMTGKWPDNQIDHRNRIPDDNRFQNLRDCTGSINCHNQNVRKNNTSGYAGVYRLHGRWAARICVNMKSDHLGLFDTAEEAAAAYRKAKMDYRVVGP